MNRLKELLDNPLFYLWTCLLIMFFLICALFDRQADFQNKAIGQYWELKSEQWNLKKEISDG